MGAEADAKDIGGAGLKKRKGDNGKPLKAKRSKLVIVVNNNNTYHFYSNYNHL